MKTSLARFTVNLSCLSLATILLFSSSSFGQIWINDALQTNYGKYLENHDSIKTAEVRGNFDEPYRTYYFAEPWSNGDIVNVFAELVNYGNIDAITVSGILYENNGDWYDGYQDWCQKNDYYGPSLLDDNYSNIWYGNFGNYLSNYLSNYWHDYWHDCLDDCWDWGNCWDWDYWAYFDSGWDNYLNDYLENNYWSDYYWNKWDTENWYYSNYWYEGMDWNDYWEAWENYWETEYQGYWDTMYQNACDDACWKYSDEVYAVEQKHQNAYNEAGSDAATAFDDYWAFLENWREYWQFWSWGNHSIPGYLVNDFGASIGVLSVAEHGIVYNLGTIETAKSNGGSINNVGHIDTSYGNAYNYWSGTINVSHDAVYNSGTVGTTNGSVTNEGTIGTANVGDGATVCNGYSEASVSAFGLSSWVIRKGIIDFWGVARTGIPINSNGTISSKRFIDTVNVRNRGWLQNAGTIDKVFLNGGMVDNKSCYEEDDVSRIENLTYTEGKYNGNLDWLNRWEGAGTIGTLIIAGDSTGIDWGIVDELKFHDNGNGIVCITATAGDNAPVESFMAFQAASVSLNSNISFSGIQAKYVDLTNGKIEIILGEGLTLEDLAGFSLADFFGAETVVGIEELDTLNITIDGETTSIIVGGEPVNDVLDIDLSTGEIVSVGDDDGGNNDGGNNDKTTFISATPSAYVEKLTGNQNRLMVTVTELYSDESSDAVSATFMINNNATGTYTVGDYRVYVDTKGNTQIRACYIVE